nr:divalent-cation tolerance protein CutA [Acuticoccus mangrovi]
MVAETTTPTREIAEVIAAALVERREAACVHIMEISSVFRWEGGVENESEWRLSAKTVRARLGAVKATIAELHTYDLPAFCATPADASSEFGRWVMEECAPVLQG